MTRRIKGFWVALEQDICIDDAQPLMEAVKQLRGVAAVTATDVNTEDWMNRERALLEIKRRLASVLTEPTQAPVIKVGCQ